jgi:hypothetical protein
MLYDYLGLERISVGKPEEKRPLGMPDVGWRIILKWIIVK